MSDQKNVRRAARLYHDWDANVVAIKSSGSSPYKNTVGRWKHLHEGRQSADELHRAGFDHPDLSGVGIVHGPGDYRHFDIDGSTSFTVVERILNALRLPHTYRWLMRTGSGNGFGITFRCKDELPSDLLTTKAGESGVRIGQPRDGLPFAHIELRWERCQSVYPPSRHASGGKYEYINGAPEGPPPYVEIGRVVDALNAVCAKPEATQPTSPAPAHDLAAPDARPSDELARHIVDIYIGKARKSGLRNETGFDLACQLRDNGFTKDEAIHHGACYVDTVAHDRPEDEYTADEYAESIEQAYSREPRKPWAQTLDVDAWLEGKAEATDGDVIEALAALSSVEYDRRREAACKRLKIRVGTLDAEVKARRPEEPEEVEDTFETPEPWPEEVDAEELLSEVYETIRRYVVFEEADAIACTLWSLHTYALEAAEASPILAITSPEKRCGKTTLLSVLGALAYRPASGASFSKAAVYRVIEKYGPTLLLDEADTFLRPGQNEELRGVINSGHTRGTAHVWVCVGDDHEPTRFSTWAPKVIACIGELPDTIADRSIEVKMRRKTGSDKVERFRSRAVRELLPLRRRMRRWAEDNFETLADSDPDVPRSLNDRAADSWATLLAVADRAGGDWPRRARHAAETLSGSTTADVATRGTELLSDLRQIFESKGNPDALPTADILEALHAMEERPWPTYHRGKELSARGLASLLKPFEVTSISVRLPNGSTPKGYKLSALHDTFARYLPPTSATAPQTEINGNSEPETAISAESASATDSPVSGSVADRKTAQNGDSESETANPPDLWRVADKNGGPGGEGVSGDGNVLYIDPSDPDPLPF